MTLLAVDIGNSNVHLGVQEAPGGPWTATWRFSSRPDQTADEWYSTLAPHLDRCQGAPPWTRVVACSVVPALTTSLADFARKYLQASPLMVSSSLELGLTVATHQPHETGADRIVNAAVAFAEFGGPVVIVDMGTATKIDAVAEHGIFLGGSIAPGIGLSMESLTQRAAQLRAVPLALPERAIGHNTTEAIQSGVILGHSKMIDGMVRQITTELGGARAVVLTGGYSVLVGASCETVTHHRPNLTLEGLAYIAARNS